MNVYILSADESQADEITSILESQFQFIFHASQTLQVFQTHSEQIPPDLILCDLSDTESIEVLDYVHSHFPGVDVILISKDPNLKNIVRALNSGAIALLHQPVVAEELLGYFKNAVKKRLLWISNEEYKTGLEKKVQDQMQRLEMHASELEQQVQSQAAQLVNIDRIAMLRDLMNGIAHDFNNPNAYIRSEVRNLDQVHQWLLPFLKEIKQRHPDEKLGTLSIEAVLDRLPKMTSGIFEATTRILANIEDLTHYCGLEAQDEQDAQGEVNLIKVVKKAQYMAKFIIRETAEVEFISPEEVSCVLGSELQLRQVFLNLLVNACHAIQDRKLHENKQGMIKIQLEEEPPGQDYMSGCIRVKIEDNGVGIPEPLIKRIFSPYFTTKEQGRGSGLGLAITMGIVRQHHGDLKVHSIVGEGTTFVVTLPCGEKRG